MKGAMLHASMIPCFGGAESEAEWTEITLQRRSHLPLRAVVAHTTRKDGVVLEPRVPRDAPRAHFSKSEKGECFFSVRLAPDFSVLRDAGVSSIRRRRRRRRRRSKRGAQS